MKPENEDSDASFFMTSDKSNIYSQYKKQILEEVGLKEDELRSRPPESFQEPGMSSEMIRLRHERYEALRKEKMKMVKKAIQDRMAAPRLGSRARNFGRFSGEHTNKRAESFNPNLDKSFLKYDDSLFKQNTIVAKQLKVSENREKRFEEEVQRIEQQFLQQQQRLSQRNQGLQQRKESSRQKQELLDNRRHHIKMMMESSKKQMQVRAIERGRSYLARIENLKRERERQEHERSRTLHRSFLKKTKEKAMQQSNYFNYLQEASRETEQQLEAYHLKMGRSEQNYLKHQQKVSRTAASFLQRNSTVYSRSLKEKQISPEKVHKLLIKYRQMAELAKRKEQTLIDKVKRRRDEYLDHVQKMEETKQNWERIEAKKINEVVERRQAKEAQALQNRLNSSIEFQGKFEHHRVKLQEAKEKILHLKEEEKIFKDELLQKEFVKNQYVEQMKSYQKHITQMKVEAAAQLLRRKQRSIDCSNPYKIAEMRSTQKYFQCAPSVNPESTETNKTILQF